MQAFNHGSVHRPWTACAIPLLCAATIQSSTIGYIYFAVLSVSLQFIATINGNSKYTWVQYYRQSHIACKRYPRSCAEDVTSIKEISAARLHIMLKVRIA
jgi:hypothetical protein